MRAFRRQEADIRRPIRPGHPEVRLSSDAPRLGRSPDLADALTLGLGSPAPEVVEVVYDGFVL